jgi:class 3 adenylate cyclase
MPLHQIISYAELILEDCHQDSAGPLNGVLSRMISSCEQSLAALATAGDHEDVETLVSSLHQQLIPPSRMLESSVKELRSRIDSEQTTESKRDLEKLCRAVVAFEEAVQETSTESVRMLLPVSGRGHFHDSAVSRPVAAEGASQFVTVTGMAPLHRGLLLVVDDDEGNRDVLARRLLRDGHEVMLAEGGRQALRMVQRYDFDLVLLDLMMPEMDGLQVLVELRRNPKIQQLPVIMISAADEIESVVRSIERGADDYLVKPFNPVVLRARINGLLERKRLQDQERTKKAELEKALAAVEVERTRTRELLLNILPAEVAGELQERGDVQPMYFEDVTIVFADIVNFTLSTEHMAADELVAMLHQYFTSFDQIMAKYELEKLKTIGDCYMYAGGIPSRRPSHPVDSVLAALEMIEAARAKVRDGGVNWQLRIGVHTGPVIAGVVGIRKFAFDIWGDSVNFSSRVQSSGAASRVNLSRNTFMRIKDFFACEPRGLVKIKDGREVEMYFVNGVAAGLLANRNRTPRESFEARYRTYFRRDLNGFPCVLEKTELPVRSY